MIKGESDFLVMEQIAYGRIAPPQSRRPELPDELCEIIKCAIATERDRRYATADELRVALEQFAWKAGLTAPTSAIAAFMQQQFGTQPEPWLELGDQGRSAIDNAVTADNAPPASDDSVSNDNWSEQPRSDGDSRSTSRASRSGDRLNVLSGTLVPAGSRGVPQGFPDTPPPSDPKNKWDGQPRGSVLRSLPVRRLAMIIAVPIAAAAIWLVASLVRTQPAPVVAPLASPFVIAPPRDAKPAAVARTPDLLPATPAQADPVPAPPAALAAPPTNADVARAPEPSPARRTRSPASAATSRAVGTVIETSPARPRPDHPKPERSPRVASAAAQDTPTLGGDPDLDDDGLRHPAAPQPSPPPAPAPIPTPQAPPPMPPPAVPQVVAPAALDAYRIAGERTIVPDAVTMDAISRAGADTVVSTYKLCVTAEGNINVLTQMRSSNFPAYDEKIRNTIRRDWRYRPFLLNGKPTPVCTALRFIYSQR
jgi:hypothetical protein